MLPASALQGSLAEAVRLNDTGLFADAAALCRRALRSGGARDVRLLSEHARALTGLQRHHDARETIQKALKIQPASLDLRRQLIAMLLLEERADDAQRAARALLTDHPGDTPAVRLLSEALRKQGRRDEALAVLEEGARARPDDMHLCIALMRLAGAAGQHARGVEAAHRLLNMPAVPDEVRIAAWFEMAALLDALGEFDRAFDAAAQANRLSKRQFDRAAFAGAVDRLIEVWTPDALARLPRAGRSGENLIFIVGMVRSGTSLVEQILSSHPRVFGAGELRHVSDIVARLQGRAGPGYPFLHDLAPVTPDNLERAAAHYREQIRLLAPGAEFVTDKMPANVLHVGLISVMLPGAKIVHCVRDARDTCLSCWMLDFAGRFNSFAYDLEDLGEHFAGYWRLMKHWKRLLPGAILDVRYEALTADQEGESRRLLEFAGLPWDDRCLRFHETRRDARTLSVEPVKKRIYPSSEGLWRHYEHRLGPLLARLPVDALFDADGAGGGRPPAPRGEGAA